MEREGDRRVRVVIADDHGLVRRGTKEILEQSGSIVVVGEAADGVEAVEVVERLDPHVVLLDIGMPRMNGIEAAEAIAEKCPDVQILILTGHGDVEYVWQSIRAGASGYVLKDASDAALVNAVRLVAERRSVLDPSITHLVLDRVRQESMADVEPQIDLTAREKEALGLAARGLSNKDIAGRLDRSSRTVEVHLRNAFKKLGVGSRTEGVVAALKLGLISLEDDG